MATQRYTDEELQQYFRDPANRRQRVEGGDGAGDGPPEDGRAGRRGHGVRARVAHRMEGYRGFLYRRLGDERKVEGAFAVSVIAGLMLGGTFLLFLYMILLSALGRTPSLNQIDNPHLDLATVAYTADGKELARYGRQNRSWVTLDAISPHVIQALIATEDHRFYDHWGVDLFRTVSAVAQTATGDVQGGSTITQQLARNLYNEQIGFDRSPFRKIKEMITAVQLERRYTKDEIIEMYLNTVPYRHNAYGIEAAAKTYFSKPAKDLDLVQSATLVGMLKATTRYDPVRNPQLSAQRRNVVLGLMVKHGVLDQATYDQHREGLTETQFRSSDVTDSFAPYFAEYVRNWLAAWGEKNKVDVYAEGLVVYTTLDSRLQEMAQAAVAEQMEGLQDVVDYEWGHASGHYLGGDVKSYAGKTGFTPFAHLWRARPDLLQAFIQESGRFRALREAGVSAEEALAQLRKDKVFMDSLKADKSRLEAGLVSMDPRTGHIKAWVGGRDLKTDWYDHIANAKRQPGSTFKPFVYTAAIDNGYAPSYSLRDYRFTYVDPVTGQRWSPENSGGGYSGGYMSLRQGLSMSKNTITAQLILEIQPSTAAFYARRMGIESKLDEVPALALGTSDVSLLELATAYATLASGGLRHDPLAVTRIEDKNGNVLYEAESAPREALSEATAYTVVDMLRDVVDQPYGTGNRIRRQFGLTGYDFAGKTGTTQNSADGWFMLMHPDLVTGSWVGFNDRRITFRTTFWGQGAHNALFLVGDFLRRASKSPVGPSKESEFPRPEEYRIRTDNPTQDFESERIHVDDSEEEERERVGW